MSTFVLVHGGWHGAWCWRPVAWQLRGLGHDVVTPTLTGLGHRAHLVDDRIDLWLHITDVVSVIEYEGLEDIVLVGHSYGGMVITGVADRMPERIAHLVYLDAFVPAHGQCLFDLLPPNRRAIIEGSVDAGMVPAPSAESFGVTDAEQAAWVDARLVPQPVRTMRDAVQLAQANRVAALPHTFVHCTHGATATTFAVFVERLRDAPGWRHRTLATGHDAMITMPAGVVAILDEAVGP